MCQIIKLLVSDIRGCNVENAVIWHKFQISLFKFWFRSSHYRCSIKKGILRNFAKFTGKHLCQSLFFNKVAGGLWHRCFPVKFAKFLRTPFSEHLWMTASADGWWVRESLCFRNNEIYFPIFDELSRKDTIEKKFGFSFSLEILIIFSLVILETLIICFDIYLGYCKIYRIQLTELIASISMVFYH